MTTKQPLVHVGSLKPLSWFRNGDCQVNCLLLRSDGQPWYVYFLGGNFYCAKIGLIEMVEPLPDCTSFDWQEPREPTALELIQSMRKKWSGQYAEGVGRELDEIIAAMEREQAK